MSNYVFRVILSRLLMIWLVMTVTFFIVHTLPGNPIDQFILERIEKDGLSEQEARQRASIVLCFDLDGSLNEQYLRYFINTLHGDLGNSCAVAPNEPVINLVLANLPWTLFSVGTSILISFFIGIFLGMLAAYQRNTGLDYSITHLSALIDAIPGGMIAVMLIFFVAVVWRLVPASEMRGAFSPGMQPGITLPFVMDVLKHYIWPGSIYILITMGSWALAMRSSTLSVLQDDYVMAAHARGLSDMRILTAYIGNNASLPLITRLGISLSFILSGSVLIEQVFVYRGVGALLLSAIAARDYALMQGIFLLISITVIFSTILMDLLYGWFDPRVRINNIRG